METTERQSDLGSLPTSRGASFSIYSLLPLFPRQGRVLERSPIVQRFRAFAQAISSLPCWIWCLGLIGKTNLVREREREREREAFVPVKKKRLEYYSLNVLLMGKPCVFLLSEIILVREFFPREIGIPDFEFRFRSLRERNLVCRCCLVSSRQTTGWKLLHRCSSS